MIELEHPVVAGHTAALAERADALLDQVAELAATSDVLLAGWRGRTAVRVAGEAEAWRSAALDVVRELLDTVEGLRAARHDLAAADDLAVEGQARLRGRLS